MLNIYFLGKTRIEYSDKIVTDSFRNKTIALICLLVLNHNKYLSRDKILNYLWPDSGEDAAKNNLRYNLWLIKKNIGPNDEGEDFLVVNKEYCGINKSYEFECDILEILNYKFHEQTSIADLKRLKALFVGEFFEGYYYNKCEDFNEVIIFQRMQFENYKVQILKRLEKKYEEEGNVEKCLDTIKEILEIEPYDEDAAVKILDLYLKMGNRSSGIIFYNSFRERLVNRLGIQTSEKLRKKYEELKHTDEVIIEPEGFGTKHINTICMNAIPYFWIADVVGKLFEEIDLDCENRINENSLMAFGYIQPSVLSKMYPVISIEIPSVQIINAFIKLIIDICREYQLIITIQSSKDMDEMSSAAFQYLKRCQITSLKMIEA